MGNVESSEFYRDVDAGEYGTERRQAEKHLPESALCRRLETSKLLDDLSKTFENWQEIIINMRTNQMPEHYAQEYLYQEMLETRDKLNKIMGYMKPLNTSQLQPCESAKKPKEQQRQKTSTPMKSTKGKSPGVKALERNVELYKQKSQQYQAQTTELTLMYADLQEHLNRIDKERSEVLLRLSNLTSETSETLPINNPNLADLSDPHRPTKLGEMFSNVYDNELEDAFEALQAAGKGDRRSIQILLETFMDIYNFCHTQRANFFEIKQKTACLLELLENDSSNTCTKIDEGKSPGISDEDHAGETQSVIKKFNQKRQAVQQEVDKHLQSLQQEFGEALLPFIGKAYIQAQRNNSCVEELKPYIQKCLKVAWLMCIKSPPMAVAEIPQAGDPFNCVLYKQYTHKGPYMDYMVWPAILLNEKGAIVSKGVAQGKE